MNAILSQKDRTDQSAVLPLRPQTAAELNRVVAKTLIPLNHIQILRRALEAKGYRTDQTSDDELAHALVTMLYADYIGTTTGLSPQYIEAALEDAADTIADIAPTSTRCTATTSVSHSSSLPALPR